MELDYDDKLNTIKNLRAVIEEKAKENITKRQASYKKYYDKKHEEIPLKVGDWVFVREVKKGRLTKKKNKWKDDYKVIGFPTPTTCSMCNWQGHKVNDALLINVKQKYPGLTLNMLEELSKTEDNTYNQEFLQATQPNQDLPDLPEMPKDTPEVPLNADNKTPPKGQAKWVQSYFRHLWWRGHHPGSSRRCPTGRRVHLPDSSLTLISIQSCDIHQVPPEEEDMSQCAASSQPLPESEPPGVNRAQARTPHWPDLVCLVPPAAWVTWAAPLEMMIRSTWAYRKYRMHTLKHTLICLFQMLHSILC